MICYICQFCLFAYPNLYFYNYLCMDGFEIYDGFITLLLLMFLFLIWIISHLPNVVVISNSYLENKHKYISLSPWDFIKYYLSVSNIYPSTSIQFIIKATLFFHLPYFFHKHLKVITHKTTKCLEYYLLSIVFSFFSLWNSNYFFFQRMFER